MKELNPIDFPNAVTKGRVLVDFFAEWCGPCQMLMPILDELEKEYPEIIFYRINSDSSSDLCKKWNIISIPVLLLFNEGKLIKTIYGYQPKTSIQRFLDNYG